MWAPNVADIMHDCRENMFLLLLKETHAYICGEF